MLFFPSFLEAVLPDGFALPPLAYLAAILALTAAIGVLLYALRPPVKPRTIVAFTPWMIVGATLNVLYALEVVDPLFQPLLGTPMVYFTTFVLAGGFWAVFTAIGVGQKAERRIDYRLGAIGSGIAIASLGYVILLGLRTGSLELFWPLVVILATAGIWALTWLILSLWFTSIVAKTGVVGSLVVLSHILDGVSTAIGIDFLGVHEQSPIPRAIMDFASTLPTAELIGSGWLFVGVKIMISLLIIWLFADYVEEAPAEAYLLLGAIAAVGLGPGVHNVLLFLLAG